MCKNNPHRCKIKLEKFHFDILCCYGVIKESLPRGGEMIGEIGLKYLRPFPDAVEFLVISWHHAIKH